MNITVNNANLAYVVSQQEQTLELQPLLRATDGNYYPPLTSGEHDGYNPARGYYVDLTGLYAQGYRKVRFKANKYTGASGSCMGLIGTNDVPTVRNSTDTVESTASTANVGAVEWYELPLTANSKCLHSLYTYTESSSHPELVVWEPQEGDVVASTAPITT